MMFIPELHACKKKIGILQTTTKREVKVLGIDVWPHIIIFFDKVTAALAWLTAIIAAYLWLSYALRLFPYTKPWGDDLASYLQEFFLQMCDAIVRSIPSLFAVAIIFTLTRWFVRLAQALFTQIEVGTFKLTWFEPEFAQATSRLTSALTWLFAIVVAYPYIPGSHTEAFKGVSVFIGLMVSLGSTGIINQMMSGLYVVYAKALKANDYVGIGEVKGFVTKVGLLAAKIRTVEGQEVRIPNSVLVNTPATNYTRLAGNDGMVVATSVSIGYDTAWRQVRSLLLLAASRTSNIRKSPRPKVLQRALDDFYVEYMLLVHLEDGLFRHTTLSELHEQIQDAFNEFGVQIMSPHFRAQPERTVVVPRSHWFAPPAAPPEPARTIQVSNDEQRK